MLKIQPENPMRSILPSNSNKTLREMEIGNTKQFHAKLLSLIQNAADMLKLFERSVTQEGRNDQYVEQIIRRKQSMQQPSVLYAFQSTKKLPSKKIFAAPILRDKPNIIFRSHSQKNAMVEDAAWAELLFGPRGILTAIFHILDDRREITKKISGKTATNKNIASNRQTTETSHQSDLLQLPDFLIDAEPIDFAKIFGAFLTGTKNNFDENILNLPEMLGICNRLSCGDIYKAIDEFRKSEFFINFQTALQLIQDPKGWQILGDLISNPDLIAQFINGSGTDRENTGNLFRSITHANKSLNKEIGPEDGDIGINFSKMVENGHGSEFGKYKKPTAEELPEIAENIDAVDYYNAIESGIETDVAETIVKPDVVAIPENTTSSIKTNVPAVIPENLFLPEISENIDEGQTEIIIDATMPSTDKISNHRLNISLRRLRPPYITITEEPVTVRTTTVPKQTVINSNTAITTPCPALSRKSTTATRLTPKTTTRNFREDSDYYAMYYDDVNG